ncbi:MAG TPA: RDD family protein [Dermatophilaceae bacterium]|nr:RDD family protein [Dermatophilaceae bacterium]
MSAPWAGTVGVGADDLVTGEAVALELPPASLPIRIVSGFIDLVATGFALWGAAFVAILLAADADDAVMAAVGLSTTVLVLVGGPTTLETLTRGRTLGKLALGLRTVRDDAGPISFRHALTRALVGVVEIWVFAAVPAVLSSLVSSKGKRLGDLAAGTYVVRERVRVTLPTPPQMPASLQPWAQQADIARLPDELALAVRQYLVRAPTLALAARASLAGQLHSDVLRYVAPPPPAGTPTEALLAAVLADRRRRDGERLRRDAALRARLVPPDPLARPPDRPV